MGRVVVAAAVIFVGILFLVASVNGNIGTLGKAFTS